MIEVYYGKLFNYIFKLIYKIYLILQYLMYIYQIEVNVKVIVLSADCEHVRHFGEI